MEARRVVVRAGEFDLFHGTDEAPVAGLALSVEEWQIVTVGRFEDPFAGIPVAADTEFADGGLAARVDNIVPDVRVAVGFHRCADLKRHDGGVGILP